MHERPFVHRRGEIERGGGTHFYPWEGGRLGSPRPCFHWRGNPSQRLVVQHPFIGFDPASASIRTSEVLEGRNAIDVITGEDDYCAGDECNKTLILHETFEIGCTLSEFVVKFPRALEDACRMPKDRFLWTDTGAWIVETADEHYLGLGPTTIQRPLGRGNLARAAYVWVATSSIIGAVWNARTPARLTVETCFGNRFLSFAEEAAFVDEALSRLGDWRRTFSRVEDWEDLHRPPPDEAREGDLERYGGAPEPLRLVPVAVVKTRVPRGFRGPQFDYAIFPRPETEIPVRSLREQSFVLGHLRGGNWMTEDFDDRFAVSGTEIIFLESLLLVSWRFDFREEDATPF